jgi:hypothetical protein
MSRMRTTWRRENYRDNVRHRPYQIMDQNLNEASCFQILDVTKTSDLRSSIIACHFGEDSLNHLLYTNYIWPGCGLSIRVELCIFDVSIGRHFGAEFYPTLGLRIGSDCADRFTDRVILNVIKSEDDGAMYLDTGHISHAIAKFVRVIDAYDIYPDEEDGMSILKEFSCQYECRILPEKELLFVIQTGEIFDSKENTRYEVRLSIKNPRDFMLSRLRESGCDFFPQLYEVLVYGIPIRKHSELAPGACREPTHR